MPEHVADNLLRDRRPQHFNRTGVTEHMRPRFPGGSTPAADNRPRTMPYRFVIAI
jgi:hypothetical protein